MYLLTNSLFFRPRILKKNDVIKNKKRTASFQAQSGSWKQHWVDSGRRKWPKVCQRRNCNNSAEVGAHIKIRKNKKDYVFPLCNACNLTKKGKMKPKANSAAYSIAKKDNAD